LQRKLRLDQLLLGVGQPHVRKHVSAAFGYAPSSGFAAGSVLPTLLAMK
jgi:hypothetical protein